MKNSSDTIRNRARDLLTCSAVPQPTALWCAPLNAGKLNIILMGVLAELQESHTLHEKTLHLGNIATV